MDSEQPYRPPTSDVGGPPAGLTGAGAGSITHGIIETLKRTRPWTLFMGIMVLLGSGFMVLAGIVMMVIGGMGGAGSPFGGLGGVLIGFVYLALALLYLVPGIYLLRFSGAIRRVSGEAPAQAVEQALRYQLSFWRFVGILTIAVIGIYLLIIVVAIFVGASSAI